MRVDGLARQARELASRAGLQGMPAIVAVVAAGVLVLVAGVSLVRVASAPSDSGAVRVEASSQRSVPITDPSTEATETTLWVHVVGAVRRPGVYRIPSGSRVASAVEEAGGMLGDAAPEAVNLARTCADGEQIVVPTHDQWADGTGRIAAATPGGSVPPAAGGAGTGMININVAGVEELDTLPGVGPSTAQKIVSDREANGPFSTPEDLGRVSGIGARKLEALSGLISVR